MCKPLRLCLDLNIWCAALLADIKGNKNSACQSIVNLVRCGKYASGKIELVISWGMLNRLEKVLLRLTPLAKDASFYVSAIANYAPQLTLGGTGVIAIDDIEDQMVLETALAGKADMLITANFQDFLNKDVEIIIPQKHGIYHSPNHNINIIHPYLAIQWLNQGNIPSLH
ncbi:PIN domain-containing protein [Geminocystis sp. GBBB08]|uniref:PIN domain-containing protein n=1 Tax=Geminocystis sp. GBBB08 TaxID=2604140 RepID=UPI0027E386C3|nr:PIN domain-containing protein [Geminocystis sp. GBBB08]MBL1208403.1 PIN domain-containing protein [Geminocystis sp. GBBB08]